MRPAHFVLAQERLEWARVALKARGKGITCPFAEDCGKFSSRGRRLRHSESVPRKIKLPLILEGTAFLTTDATVSGFSQRRLLGRDLKRPYRGVRSLRLGDADVLKRCRAYEPRMPQTEFFSHVTAAQLYRMPLPPWLETEPTLHVSTLRSVCRPRMPGVVGHRLSASHISTRLYCGFVVADPVTVWFQLAALLDVDDLIAVGDYLISGRRTDFGREPALAAIDEIAARVAQLTNRRGARKIAEAVGHLRSGVDSRPESRMRMLLIRSGLPEPMVNDVTFDRTGRKLGTPDLKFVWARTVLEYEGEEHRSSKSRFRRDIFRRELFEDADWRVIRVVSEDIFDRPHQFIARVKRTLARRKAAIASGQLLP